MKDHSLTDAAIGLVIGIVLSSIVLPEIFGPQVRNDWEHDCVKHHAAHYDPQTATFKWNDEKP